MSATATGPKIRYSAPGQTGFQYATFEELPDYAHEQEQVRKQLAKHGLAAPESVTATATPARDYSELIEGYFTQLREARETVRRSGGDRAVRDECEMKIDQYGSAIENARAAERITDQAANFVSLTGEFSFRLPPRVDGQYTTETRRSMSRCYLATDPLEIAWLRRMTQAGGVREVALTDRVAVPKDGQAPRIVDAKTWFQMLDLGMVNP